MFVLQCRKISYLNLSVLCFRKFPVAKKFMDKRGGKVGGSITIFRQKFFYLTVPKNSVGEPFSVSLFPGIEKFYASEGCHSFMSKFFCLTVPKKLKVEPFCAVFQKISHSEKVYGKVGGRSIKNFRRKFFVPE